jgi:glycine/D-amino acid oxidase-like deaminating enzyme
MPRPAQIPPKSNYDVVIIGGAIMGSATAWFLTNTPDFTGSVLVIDRDLTYKACSTTHTSSCMRQQFSTELNIKISQFAADFVKNIRDYMGGDDRVPHLCIHNFGYMYLANSQDFATVLRQNQKVQLKAGTATELLTADAIKARYPFYNVDDIILGSINTIDEGFWDAQAVFDAWRRQAREAGVDYIENEVVAITRNPKNGRVDSVTLKSGDSVSCGHLVNAAGPRAAHVARMAGLDVPVEARKRYSWVFAAARPLDIDLPLTIDPSGVHIRENGGGTYQCGGAHSSFDPAVDYDDYTMDFSIWETHVWPAIAARIPQFDTIKVQSEWVGHYAMNSFDHNAITGPHPDIPNFMFLNGFSGHGLQQSPAMGRATAEWITYGQYHTLDMTPFHYDRIPKGRPITESAII